MVPYESIPVVGIEVTGGQHVVVEVDFPARAAIDKVVVQQTDGVIANFEVKLFGRNIVLGNSDSVSDGDSAGQVPESLYQHGPTLSGTNGYLGHFPEVARSYVNRDPYAQGRQGMKTRKIYVRISPAGTGPKVFAVIVGGYDAVE